MMKEVLVLMSTYNGEKYLQQQIDSILSQKGVAVRLLVRDDGSSDYTIEILKKYQEKGCLTFYTGENLGPQRSFLHLLQHAPQCAYYAFADQDDVWMSDKLATAVSCIEGSECVPALYFSQTQLTDKDLNPIPSVIIHPRLTFGEMLIYKFIGGCTMVMNEQLRKVVGNYIPERMPMHDLWIYSIASLVDAHIVFDETPHILYRQHGDNTVGQGQGFFYEWKKRWERFTLQRDDRYLQALELSKGYAHVAKEKNATLLKLFLSGKKNIRNRMSMLVNSELRCSNRTTQLLFWINVICNKY